MEPAPLTYQTLYLEHSQNFMKTCSIFKIFNHWGKLSSKNWKQLIHVPTEPINPTVSPGLWFSTRDDFIPPPRGTLSGNNFDSTTKGGGYSWLVGSGYRRPANIQGSPPQPLPGPKCQDGQSWVTLAYSLQSSPHRNFLWWWKSCTKKCD